mmetsp:Transcript_5671/g.8612  ORF Transcript_5671/g.8612 Transcript_5671/m.8612 type:complete len:259 (-) Transcript_5671:47-823(-)
MTAGVIAATLLISATTIDDAIWLVPYCTSPHLPTWTKIIHGATFVITLELLSIFCVLVSNIFQGMILFAGRGRQGIDASFVLGLVGAIICWAIAIGLYIKKMMKRRKRALAAVAAETLETEEGITISAEDNSLIASDGDEEDVDVNAAAAGEIDDDDSSNGSSDGGRDIPSTPSIRMVASLTTLGALDEISYFPAILVGHVFSPVELCVGTLFATLIILVIVLLFLSKFKPVVDFLDSIPLYGIVGTFAVILTAELFC